MSSNIGREFIQKTRFQAMGRPPQQTQPQPPLELPYSPQAELIPLPEHDQIQVDSPNLKEVIEGRRTLRRYSSASLTMAELSYLLWLTQGVQAVSERPATVRTVPSAGARHAFETYLLINRVDGLASGLYRYIALEHALISLPADADITDRLTQACRGQEHVRSSAVTFVWAAVTERMTWRYPERGYRYLLLDAGHVCQNLYLAAETIQCGVCAIAAYDDDLLNAVLGLDGDDLFAIYAASLGKK